MAEFLALPCASHQRWAAFIIDRCVFLAVVCAFRSCVARGTPPMPIAEKIAALFQALTREEVDAMSPAQRERFGQLCEHWANFSKLRPSIEPKAGVLVQLKGGRPG